jgi:hypothetical protein
MQKSPTVREVGRSSRTRELGRSPSFLIKKYGLAAHEQVFAALLEEGEELCRPRRFEGETVFKAKRRASTP